MPEDATSELILPRGKFDSLELKFKPNGGLEPPLHEAIRDINSKVIILADHHPDERIRWPLNRQLCGILKEDGFTHYFIEGSADIQDQLDALKRGERVDLWGMKDLGPGSFTDKSFARAISFMNEAGLMIIAIDHPDNAFGRSVTTEDREQFMYERVHSALSTEGRGLILVGGGHTSPGRLSGVPTLAERLLNRGVDITTINFHDPQGSFKKHSTFRTRLY